MAVSCIHDTELKSLQGNTVRNQQKKTPFSFNCENVQIVLNSSENSCFARKIVL